MSNNYTDMVDAIREALPEWPIAKLTKRELFAATALAGLVSDHVTLNGSTPAELSRSAVNLADDLITELKT